MKVEYNQIVNLSMKHKQDGLTLEVTFEGR